MSTKLVVSNLPPDVIDRQLKRLLGRFGEVAALNIVRNPKNGKCLGDADIEMAEEDEAKDAVEYLNRTVWHRRELIVELCDDPFWGCSEEPEEPD
jgi:RNA recognition motif-containing protein